MDRRNLEVLIVGYQSALCSSTEEPSVISGVLRCTGKIWMNGVVSDEIKKKLTENHAVFHPHFWLVCSRLSWADHRGTSTNNKHTTPPAAQGKPLSRCLSSPSVWLASQMLCTLCVCLGRYYNKLEFQYFSPLQQQKQGLVGQSRNAQPLSRWFWLRCSSSSSRALGDTTFLLLHQHQNYRKVQWLRTTSRIAHLTLQRCWSYVASFKSFSRPVASSQDHFS